MSTKRRVEQAKDDEQGYYRDYSPTELIASSRQRFLSIQLHKRAAIRVQPRSNHVHRANKTSSTSTVPKVPASKQGETKDERKERKSEEMVREKRREGSTFTLHRSPQEHPRLRHPHRAHLRSRPSSWALPLPSMPVWLLLNEERLAMLWGFAFGVVLSKGPTEEPSTRSTVGRKMMAKGTTAYTTNKITTH
jgi:hypothetical protein